MGGGAPTGFETVTRGLEARRQPEGPTPAVPVFKAVKVNQFLRTIGDELGERHDQRTRRTEVSVQLA
jgi:hypothetical protein